MESLCLFLMRAKKPVKSRLFSSPEKVNFFNFGKEVRIFAKAKP